MSCLQDKWWKNLGVRRLMILLLVMVACQIVAGRHDEVDITSSDAFIELVPPFGTINGSLRLQLSCHDLSKNIPETLFHVAVFSREEWIEIQQYKRRLTGLCILPSLLRYEFNTDLAVGAPLKKLTQYHVVLLNCKERELYCKGEALFLGENGQQLSLEEQPLINVSLFFFCAYLLSIIGWAVYVFGFRNQNQIVYSRLLTWMFCVKLAATGFELIYLISYATTGISYFTIRSATNLAAVVGDLLLVLILFSSCVGWGVTIPSLTIKERQLFWGTLLAFAIILNLDSLCEEPRTLCFAYMLSFQVMKALLAFGCGLAIAVNMAQLFGQLTEGSRRVSLQKAEIFSRLHFLGALRWHIALYFLLPSMLLLFAYTLLSWPRVSWFISASSHCVDLLTANMIAIALSHVSPATPNATPSLAH